MIVDIIFWTLGAIAILFAVGSCIAAGKSDREIEKIIKGGEK